MIEKLRWNDVTKKMPEDESVVLLWVRFPRLFANPFWTLGYVRDGIWYEHCTEIKMTTNVMYWAEPNGPEFSANEEKAVAAELEYYRAAINKASAQISGGLCYQTTEAKHEQLKDALKTLAVQQRKETKWRKK